jgi:hypothetical protein
MSESAVRDSTARLNESLANLHRHNARMQAARRRSPRHVYFIRATSSGLVKIGCASDPWGRLRAFQTGSAERLALVGVIPNAGRAGERELHELFASFRAHGEWFYPSEELDAAIGACR